MSTHQTLSLDNGVELAYVHHAGSGPGVIFMGGFMSDMSGSKALAMEEYCVSNIPVLIIRGMASLQESLKKVRLECGILTRWPL